MGNQTSKAVLVASSVLGISLLWLHVTDTEENGGTGGTVGIVNLGNTCFLSALLQAFSSSRVFSDYLNSLDPRIVEDTQEHDFAIVKELQAAVSTLRTGKSHLRPLGLVEHLTHKFPHFGEQQDSHEIFLLLHDALTTVRDRPSLLSLTRSRIGLDPMLGLMTNTVTCLHCHNKTLTNQTFSYLYLDWKPDLSQALFAMSQGETVEYDCLQCSVSKTKRELARQFTASEGKSSLFERPMDGLRIGQMISSLTKAAENEEEDKVCLLLKSKYVARLTHQVVRLPHVLCILVKRLVYTPSGYLTKLQDHMNFPMQLTHSTGLSAILEPGLHPRAQFALTALVEHSGSALGGHYFTYKLGVDGWAYYSDTAVRKVEEQRVMKGQAYMLFYERVR